MTIAAVVSLTIIAIVQASSEYSPRLLIHFKQDMGTQVVLGIITAIMTYSLIVLLTVHTDFSSLGTTPFIPRISVLVSVPLALLGIIMLIYFIHHMTYSLQGSVIIKIIAEAGIRSVNCMCKERIKSDDQDPEYHAQINKFYQRKKWQMVPALQNGFLQSIQTKQIVKFAKKNNLIICMQHSVGAFIIKGTPLLAIISNTTVSDKTVYLLNKQCRFDYFRDFDQDISSNVQKLSDIAVRFLSTGQHDPTTSMICVDYLTAILAELCQRKINTPFFTDHQGSIRLVMQNPSFEKVLGIALDPIRENTHGEVTLLMRLTKTIETLTGFTQNKERREALARQNNLIEEITKKTVSTPQEQEKILRQISENREALS